MKKSINTAIITGWDTGIGRSLCEIFLSNGYTLIITYLHSNPFKDNTNVFADPDPNFYIFLCFGQSNMESGGRMNEMDRTVDKRFQVMADFDNERRGWKKDNWYDAVPPLTAKGSGICMVDKV